MTPILRFNLLFLISRLLIERNLLNKVHKVHCYAIALCCTSSPNNQFQLISIYPQLSLRGVRQLVDDEAILFHGRSPRPGGTRDDMKCKIRDTLKIFNFKL